MINGELIVDNFAGGTGQSKSSRAVCCGTYAEYADCRREERTAEVCVERRFL